MEEFISVKASVGASQYLDRPAVANVYAIAGRLICVESHDEESADLFRHYFSGWHVSPVKERKDHQPGVTIVVRTSAPPTAPADVQSFDVAEGGVCRTDKSTYFFENHGSVVSAGRDNPGRVYVWIAQNEQARDSRAVAQLIFNAAMTAMRRCGLYELHAAGVVAPAGAGVLIIGPSASGKSTLATTLASAGWQYLSDDSVLLYENARRVEAHALRRVFALTEESRSVAGNLALQSAATTVAPFDALKKRFEPSVAFPRRFAESCVPAALLFSRVANEPETTVRELSPSETMAQLLRICPWACYDKPVAESHLSVLAQLARHARGFELLAGEDLLHDAEYAGRLVTGLC